MSTAVEVKALPEQTNNSSSNDLEKKIIKQVEYYFGDVNMLRDNFLQEEVKKNDGWIEIDVLLRFNRLKQLTTDREVVLKALQQSKSGLLEINAETFKVRRDNEKHPLPRSTDGSRGLAILNPQTVYVKGFPLDANIDSVLDFFEKSGFPADGVYLRKNRKTNEFKGSVFATMPSKKVADEFVTKAPKMHEEREMIIMMKADYHVKKAQERVAMRQELKKRQDEIYEEKKKRTIEDQMKKMNDEIVKGAVLVLSDLPENMHEREIRTFWNNFARTAWVDFSEDRKTAYIRFEEADSAQKAWDAARAAHPCEENEKAVMINDKPLSFFKVLEGEEEETFWKGVWAALAERRANYHQNRGGRGVGRGGSRGGRGRGRGGYRGNKRPHEQQTEDGNGQQKKIKGEDDVVKKEIHMEDSDTSDDNGEN